MSLCQERSTIYQRNFAFKIIEQKKIKTFIYLIGFGSFLKLWIAT